MRSTVPNEVEARKEDEARRLWRELEKSLAIARMIGDKELAAILRGRIDKLSV